MDSCTAAVKKISALGWKGLPCSGTAEACGIPITLLTPFLFQGDSRRRSLSFAQDFQRKLKGNRGAHAIMHVGHTSSFSSFAVP